MINGATVGGDGAGLPVRQYVRSASLFERVADALHDLQLLDGALAEAARFVGIPVTDLDTVRQDQQHPGRRRLDRDPQRHGHVQSALGS